MEYFAGLDVSMAETHLCVMNRDGAVMYEVKVPSTPAEYRDGARAGSGLRADRVRDRPDGADALSRFEPAGIAHRLHREPTGLSGTEVVGDAQDRPQ